MDGWYNLAEKSWSILAENWWYILAEKPWFNLAENEWYIYVRKLTAIWPYAFGFLTLWDREAGERGERRGVAIEVQQCGDKNQTLITTTEQQWSYPMSSVPNAGPFGISSFRCHVGNG